MKIKINTEKWFPFVKTIQEYSLKKFQADLVSALTVAIIALPQSMAYAIIAGVNPKYGLYSAIIPAIVSSLFGSSKFLIAGPTNAISMVISSTLASVIVAGTIATDLPDEQKISLIFLLSFLVGAIQLVMGLAKFGSLVNFVSHSVVVGFTAGAGILIAFNQLKNFLGIAVPSSPEFVETLHLTFSNLDKTNLPAMCLGIFTVGFIILSRKISKKIPGPLLAMVASAVFVGLLGLDKQGVKLIGQIPQSLPPLSFPTLDLEMVRIIFASAMAIAILGIVEAFSIAKSIANSSGEKINGNQEFIGQGLSNMAAAFFSGIPGSGSFTRSAVNFGAGAVSRFSGVFSGILVLLTLLIFAPWARFIPIASLAGILMVIAYSMVDKGSIVLSWKATRTDRTVMTVTFLATLFLELEVAVYIGVILSLFLFLRKVSHPQVARVFPLEKGGKMVSFREGGRICPQISIFQIDGALFFGAINELEEMLYSFSSGKERIFIIRLRGVRMIDASGIHVLEKFLRYCQNKKVRAIFCNVDPAVRRVFERSGAIKEIGRKNICESVKEALDLAINQYAREKVCANCRNRIFQECPGRD